MLALHWKLFLEFVGHLLAGINEDAAGFIDVIDDVNGCSSAVLSYEGSRLEPEIPTDRV